MGDGQVYMPLAQAAPSFMTFVVRVHGNAEGYSSVCRETVRRIDSQAPVFDVQTFDQRLRESLTRPRFYTNAVLFFGVFALMLAVIGVYGVVTYSIAQRAKEIGLRIAIGASPQN